VATSSYQLTKLSATSYDLTYDPTIFDQFQANRQLLISREVDAQNIQLANTCTLENQDLFFSARGNPKSTGRFRAWIMIT